jgi:ATPase subunit of ABC transporter with duplicated ATPase domains
VSTGDRVGLVGPNGSGKTTQLKVLAGEIEPSFGDVVKSSRSMRIAYLKQEFTDELTLTNTLRQELLTTFATEMKILDGIAAMETELEQAASDPALLEEKLNKLSDLQEEANVKGVYSIDSRVEKIMDQCGFGGGDGDSLVSSFSGGWKMRIGIAKILLQEPNALLLDEPTNHLDLESVMWLEHFLVQQSIPIIIVSHDREFLDQVCNRIVDVEEGKTITYKGNYSKFIMQRQERLNSWRDKYVFSPSILVSFISCCL